MDMVMRGQFKRYSGAEFKGINIVNLMLHTKSYLEAHKNYNVNSLWETELNTYNFRGTVDLRVFKGSQTTKVNKAIDLFLSAAKNSQFTPMQNLVSDTNSRRKEILVSEAISKSEEFLADIYASKGLTPDGKKI